MSLQVSVVIPTKNEEQNIVNCIRSLQEVEGRESISQIIVVDNGSTDSTVSKAKALGAEVLMLESGTISQLRNLGADFSTGEVIAFIDADVCVKKEWLNNALICFEETKAVCVGSSPAIPEKNTWVERAWHYQIVIRPHRYEKDWLASMNMLVLKGAFDKVNGFNPNLYTCEDVDFGYRINKLGKIVFDKSITAVHFGEAKSIVQLFRKESWRGISNFDGILQHGIVLNEVRSHAVALLYLLLYPIIALTTLLAMYEVTVPLVLLSLLVPLVKTFHLIRPPVKPLLLFQIYLTWLVYCWARGFSGLLLFKRWLLQRSPIENSRIR